MKIVIVGAKERDTEEDRLLVNKLIEEASRKYPACLIVTMETPMGVGQFVKDKCLEKDDLGRFKYPLIVCSLRLYAKNLSGSEASSIYIARNATLYELGDAFIYLANADRRGTLEELVNERVIPGGRPCVVLAPGDPVSIP